MSSSEDDNYNTWNKVAHVVNSGVEEAIEEKKETNVKIEFKDMLEEYNERTQGTRPYTIQ